MKNMFVGLVAIWMMMVSGMVSAADYNLSLSRNSMDRSGNLIYEMASGGLVLVENDCEIPAYQDVRLSRLSTGDKITFEKEVPIIVDDGMGGWEIDRWDVIDVVCDVNGVMGLPDGPTTYDVIYDADSMTIYLRNIRIYNGITDTGVVYSGAVLGINEDGDAFLVNSLTP